LRIEAREDDELKETKTGEAVLRTHARGADVNMKDQWRHLLNVVAAVLVCTLAGAVVAGAQQRQAPAARAGRQAQVGENVSPQELQRMFDAYTAMQAQDELKLGNDQYAAFLARYKALQDLRRGGQRERGRLLQDLRSLTVEGAAFDETRVKDRLRALRDLDARSAAEIAKAQEVVDQTLDTRQQARFRVFEDQMERRKFELLTRARVRQVERLKGAPVQ